MKVESNWTKTRYSFICEDEKDKKFLDKMNKYIDKLEEENKNLRDENEILRCSKGGTPEKVGHEEMIQYLIGENKELKEENEILKEYKSMYEGLCN